MLPSSEVSIREAVGRVSVNLTVTPESRVRLPRSTVRLAVASLGAQTVASLPSTAASAYVPGSSDVAVAGRQRAASVVGSRSGRRVGMLSEELSVRVPAGVSTGAATSPWSCWGRS